MKAESTNTKTFSSIKRVIIMDKDFEEAAISCTSKEQVDKETRALEHKMLMDGRLIDPIIIWKNRKCLVWGYSALEIAKKYDLAYEMTEVEFESKADCLAWIAERRIAAPSLNLFQRIEIALPFGDYWKDKAKANMGKRTDLCATALESYESIDVLALVATKASTSKNTVAKVKRILAGGKATLINKCRKGDISISAAVAVVDISSKRAPRQRNSSSLKCIISSEGVGSLEKLIADGKGGSMTRIVTTISERVSDDASAVELLATFVTHATKVLQTGGLLVIKKCD
ncbi:MAG: hypothetical protein IH624_14345 [Phycisphaerae bacterium]|nr:hypothetical protein [Phycisphaerae bacterium]